MSATSNTRHTPHRASTSALARCDTESQPNRSAIKDNLCDARRGSAMRDSASESIQISLTLTPPLTDSINERSNVALCAITGQPPTKSARAATASTADRGIGHVGVRDTRELGNLGGNQLLGMHKGIEAVNDLAARKAGRRKSQSAHCLAPKDPWSRCRGR